jgi:hypothetical protein
MFKKFLFALFVISSQFSISELSAKYHHAFVAASELDSAYATLKQLPEVEALIERIEQDGPFYIEYNRYDSKKFQGYWSMEDRTIYITRGQSLAHTLTTLLFEMHNAVNTQTLDNYDRLAYNRQITRSEYIRAVELWEYENAKQTVAILNKGIEMGIFPKECHWPLHDNFEEHFNLQKSAGHSAYIGKMYDSIV